MQNVKKVILNAVKSLYDLNIEFQVSRPDAKFGDYSTNIAMQLAKHLHRSPQNIAQQIVDFINSEYFPWIKEAKIAGPGFINIILDDQFLLGQLSINYSTTMKDKSLVVEYSCPNSFKELHAGHLYQTIIGDVVARLLERGGAIVHRTNFGGDVGLHVAKSVWGITKLLNNKLPSTLTDYPREKRSKFLSKAYILGAGEYEESDIVKAEIQALNKNIYAIAESDLHNTPIAQIYWTCRKWSYDYFTNFYQNIQVDPFKYYAESMTTPIGTNLVQKGLKNDTFEYSEGAVVFKGEKYGLHTRVFITRSGLPTYETKDLGVIADEYKDYNFDLRILLTGRDQLEYMKVVYKAADLLMPAIAGKMIHLTNGTINFSDGKKMSSRLGNVITANDVLHLVYELVAKKNEDITRHAIMLAAVKYAFLKQKLGGDIAFDPEESVSLQGNSGPYLQYALVRATGILAKAQNKEVIPKVNLSEGERLLARFISMYSEVLQNAQKSYAIHDICTYLYCLASQFNKFYENNRVIGDNRQEIRLFLVKRYVDVLEDGLTLLGIQPLQKM